MKLLNRSIWIIVACLALAAQPAPAQNGADEADSEIIGPGAPAPTDGDATPADGTDEQAADDEDAADGDEQPGGTGGGGGLDMRIILLMVGVLVLFYVMSSRGRKKRETKHREMLASLKKGDKVTSIGGICGTIIEVKEDEITVKVDETNNVRMRFARWAIRGVGDSAKSETPDQQQQRK